MEIYEIIGQIYDISLFFFRLNKYSLAMNKIEIIFNGFSKNLSENVMAANCTTTLIRGNNTCVIVDTRTAWDGDELKLGLYIDIILSNVYIYLTKIIFS